MHSFPKLECCVQSLQKCRWTRKVFEGRRTEFAHVPSLPMDCTYKALLLRYQCLTEKALYQGYYTLPVKVINGTHHTALKRNALDESNF